MTLIDLDFWDLDAATVQREWQRIDIFLRDELHQFSVIIENKIDTGEHDDQLARYYERVEREFPNDRILALYLTKNGDDPSDKHYIPIGYEPVCEAIENLIEQRASTLAPDVRTLMTHYAQMLRRHILSDTDIAVLCRSISQEHKAALDLIYEHRPNRQPELTKFLQALIDETPALVRGGTYNKKQHITFKCPGWPVLNQLYFVFDNSPAGLMLYLQIGPGNEDIRRRLFELASDHQPPFIIQQEQLTRWTNIFSLSFLTASEYEEDDIQELENNIRETGKQFLQQELPPLRQATAEFSWLGSAIIER